MHVKLFNYLELTLDNKYLQHVLCKVIFVSEKCQMSQTKKHDNMTDRNTKTLR